MRPLLRGGFGLFVIAALATAGLGACRPAPVPCTVPHPAHALLSLDGSWTVRAPDGAVDGEISFDESTLRTRWDDVTLMGRWSHVSTADNRHTVTLLIDEAWQDGVRQRYGVLDQIQLELVFVSPDALVALQADGMWTTWQRVQSEPAP